MKIVFISFFDSKNIGDLLIVEVLEEKLMKSHEITKFSFNLTPEDSINNLNKNDVTKYKFLKKIYNDFFRNLTLIDKLHRFKMKRNLDNNRHLNLFKEEVKSCDLLIIGGGNAIFDLTRFSLSAYKFNKILSIAKKFNKRTFVTSIGIGPFKADQQIEYTLDTLSKADYITVRDKKSFNYIKTLNTLNKKAYLSIDPVFLLDNKFEKEDKLNYRTKKAISICIIDLLLNKDSSKKSKEYINNFVRLINELNKEGYIINLFSTEPRDYRAVNEVYSLINNKDQINLIKIKDFDDLKELYMKTDLVIGTRMHSLIIALSQFIPVIGLSWQDKVKEMFEIIESTEDVFEVSELQESIARILKLVKEKTSNINSENQLQELKKENNEKFEVNIKIVEKLIEEIALEKKEN